MSCGEANGCASGEVDYSLSASVDAECVVGVGD